MKNARTNFKDLVNSLREADRAVLREVSKKYGISVPMLTLVRRRVGGVVGVDVTRIHQLSQENATLKRLLNRGQPERRPKKIRAKAR